MYTIKPNQEFTIVEIDLSKLPGGVAEASNLESYIKSSPAVAYQKGVILSGRCPIWLMSALAHRYHVTRWVATFDPRLGGGVVISRHHKQAPAIGAVVSCDG